MICISIAAMSLFLHVTQVSVTIIGKGILVHATEGDVIYRYDVNQDAYCYERNLK